MGFKDVELGAEGNGRSCVLGRLAARSRGLGAAGGVRKQSNDKVPNEGSSVETEFIEINKEVVSAGGKIKLLYSVYRELTPSHLYDSVAHLSLRWRQVSYLAQCFKQNAVYSVGDTLEETCPN